MLKQILETLRRHSFLTLGTVTAISILFELWLFPDLGQSFLKWWSDSENKRWVIILVFSSWIILFSGILLWRFLNWNLAPSTYKERQDLLQMVVQVLGGAIIVFGVYATWQNLQVVQKNFEVVQKNFELAQQGQLSERFTKAIDQFGKDVPEVRLGGIYALEDIANSHRDQYYTQISQILSAYIRMKSAWPLDNKNQSKNNQGQITVLIPIDIQAILTFVGKYPAREKRGQVDLSKTNLYNANLKKPVHQDMNLEDVNFREIHTNGANFSEALLTGATFQGSTFEGTVIFTGSKLDHAIFTGAKMPGAIFTNANLRSAEFAQAQLQGARFTEADLTGASLSRALLMGADLSVKNGTLTQAQVDLACTDHKTILPPGLHLSSMTVAITTAGPECRPPVSNPVPKQQ